MKKRFTNQWVTALAALLLMSPVMAQDACSNFQGYFINIPKDDQANTTLYRINFDGSPALETEILIGRPAHIALSPEGLIYVVTVTGKVAIYDPIANNLGDYVWITHGDNAVFNTPQAAVDPSTGVLYVGSTDDNAVYTVDPISGVATHYMDVALGGGDLLFDANGDLWTINRYNDLFLNLNTGDSFNPGLNNVNGAGLMPDGTFIVSSTNYDYFEFVDPVTGTTTGEQLAIGVVIGNGDMATGCVPPETFEGCYASEVVEFAQGPQTNGAPVAADRSDPSKALGEPDRSNAPGGFVSLGVGGHITLAFGGAVYDGVGNDIRIFETSYSGDNCGYGDDEYAEIEVSQDGLNYYHLGTICRDGEVDIASSGLEYVLYIRISNADATATLDGYDVDGVEAIHGCQSIPVITTGDCYATEVVDYTEGVQKNGNPLAAGRNNPDKALGEPERTDANVFVTLGYGGSLILAFDGYVTNGPGADLEIVETSFNQPNGCNNYPEFADIYVSLDGVTYDFAGTICKEDGFVDISDAGDYDNIRFVKIVNNDSLSTTPDAFDVDGVVAIHNCETEGDLSDGDDQGGMGLYDAQVASDNLTAYPNPTDGDVVFTFDVNDNVHATLEVFDMSGRSIGAIFNETVNAGQEYRIPFNGRDLPSGIYIYKLTTPDAVNVKKFVIR